MSIIIILCLKVTNTYVNIVVQTDINECEEVNDCQQICLNMKGNYTCSCNKGFRLADDGTTCTGKITAHYKHNFFQHRVLLLHCS